MSTSLAAFLTSRATGQQQSKHSRANLRYPTPPGQLPNQQAGSGTVVQKSWQHLPSACARTLLARAPLASKVKVLSENRSTDRPNRTQHGNTKSSTSYRRTELSRPDRAHTEKRKGCWLVRVRRLPVTPVCLQQLDWQRWPTRSLSSREEPATRLLSDPTPGRRKPMPRHRRRRRPHPMLQCKRTKSFVCIYRHDA